MVADGANRSAATRSLKRTGGQVRYGRESRRHGYQGVEKKVERLKREARGQGLGESGRGVSIHTRAGFCILERSKRNRNPLEFDPCWSPLLPPYPYSDGASGSKGDGKR